jgi:NAD(P)-dependent dehydrogenase (short-subunit alcohol dehydrogenase family)
MKSVYSTSKTSIVALAAIIAFTLGQHILAFSAVPRRATATVRLAMADSTQDRFSIPDQPARFARAKAQQNQRYLDIESVYKPQYLKGKRVAITGANRGIGLALAQELVKQGGNLVAICRSSSPQLEALQPQELILGIDVTSDTDCSTIASKIKGGPIDILINNAGYFYEPVETIDSLNFAEQLKMIDICAIGPLRITANLFNHGLLKQKSSSVVMITSQGGSIAWRSTQNPTGMSFSAFFIHGVA